MNSIVNSDIVTEYDNYKNIKNEVKTIFTKNRIISEDDLISINNNLDLKISLNYAESLITENSEFKILTHLNYIESLLTENLKLKIPVHLNYAESLLTENSELKIPVQFGLAEHSKEIKIYDLIGNNSILEINEKESLKKKVFLWKNYADILKFYKPEDREIIYKVINQMIEENFDFEKNWKNGNTEAIIEFINYSEL